ncbi:restriction endonuclease subunit S [Streptococcus sp. CF4-2]|uniref:restriction endonuclease subunit S n=1 Tax=unclassified Streptococcus TaxID=2608887 RepID=UPI0020C9FBD7|nr:MULTISPECIES: restriction endonuclease subunit S [unclassified Streptococcus]MCP9075825.1 restriction endonuclease subunit S [Streptococcus sp. CF4-3]MCP9088916.1 restriction endonuclease subunit S [Streptococcus sp. CF4-2]
MSEFVSLLKTCEIATGKLDSNAMVNGGKYPFFTCAPNPLSINTYSFDDDVILLAGNNASGKFHCQRYTGKFDAYQRTYVITAKNNFNIDYIYYYLKMNLLSFSKKAQGSQTKFLTMKILNDFVIKNISLDNQIKISSVLKNIDQKIQINNQINQELEAMAKTLYDYWFVQFDFPDQNGKPYKSSGGKMVYNPELKREIPEGWGVEKLGELIELERGVTYAKSDIVEKTTNDAIGVLRATNITGNVMDLNDLVYLTKDKINNKQILKQNETLIVMSSGSKEHLGKNAINYYEEVIGFGAFCSKIVPKKYSTYINTFLQSSEFKGYLLKQSMGTNINNLTNSDILDCRIILPKEEILDKFENMVEKNIRLISNNYIQNKELTQLRDWLLPMLMNGQVKVE